MKPTVNVFLDQRKIQKNGKFPLKLSVTVNRTNRSWSFGFSFTEAEYIKLTSNQRKAPYKDTWNEIDGHIRKAEKIIEQMMPFFSFEEFKERYFKTFPVKVISDKTSLLYVQNEACKDYLQKGQYPMTIKIKDSVKSVLKFSKTENIPMRMISPTFCRNYEEHMFKKSVKQSRNGAGINLRHIRILFNKAITEGYIPKEWYPFKRGPGEKSEFNDAYVIPNERKVKQYLKEEELVTLSEKISFKTDAQRKAHAAFLISFYCNGANPADFLRFRYKDIQDGFIIFYREKIKNSSRIDMKPVKIFISTELQELINRVGNKPSPNSYIFDCYREGMSVEELYKARKQFCTNVSKSLKFVAESIGLKGNLRLGNARHSLANVLKRNKVDREIVKDLFGHTSIQTIDNYYESFQEDEHKKIATNFISIQSIKNNIKSDKVA